MQVNIDARLISGASILHASDQLVEFSNGCVCCTLRPELLKSIIDLLRSGSYDYAVIEASGISEPMPVAEIFDMPSVDGDEKSERLSDFARLDAAVTLVDSATFAAELGSVESLADRRMATSSTDQRSVVELLMEQVRGGEFWGPYLLPHCSLLPFCAHAGRVRQRRHPQQDRPRLGFTALSRACPREAPQP